jgi:hypothetical protein
MSPVVVKGPPRHAIQGACHCLPRPTFRKSTVQHSYQGLPSQVVHDCHHCSDGGIVINLNHPYFGSRTMQHGTLLFDEVAL